MPTLLELQLKSGSIISISVLLYVAFLARDSFFQRNRIWLLSTLIVPWLMPLVAMPVWLKSVLFNADQQAESSIMMYDVPVTEVAHTTVEASFNWEMLGTVLYTLVSLFFLIRLLWGYLGIWRLKRTAKVTSYKGHKLVLLTEGGINPFSFFRTIFMPAHLEREKYGRMILEHERNHCAQLHSIDISLAEWLLIVQWWNPFVWWLRKLIAQNHEYCVDNAMVQQTQEPQAYQYSLLNLIQSNRRVQLVNNFNQSLTKKRIVMMNKKHTNRLVGWTKNFLLIPILGVALLAFTDPYKTKDIVSADVDSKVENTNDLRNFIARSIKYPLEARDAGVEMTVSANFNVDKNGKVTNVKVGSNSTAVQLDKVVVVAYAGETGKAKQSNDVPKAAKEALENEVIRVVEKLPVIKDKALIAKKVQMDFEFMLQNRGDEVQANSVAPSLYVVDGEEVSEGLVERIDVEDITQVNVLKDQAAVDKYGERAKDGVVEVSTVLQTKDGLLDAIANDEPMTFKLESGEMPGKEPLFIVDGIKAEGREVNPESIQSVSVLKGQTAVDVYGEEAKDGVILVRTKASVRDLPDNTGKAEVVRIKGKEKGEMPLYIVDGEELDGSIKDIRSKDIESVHVLKGEQAIDKFGEEGKNGAIMIETKKKRTADEVVVMGYGSMKKGNSSSIDNIMVRQGEKAEAVRIKGRSGNEQPYVILDGEDYTGSLDDLDPDKIESISVIKDHSAEALYGDKAKNGVIIINSKK